MTTQDIPYVSLEEFEQKVSVYAETNWLLKNLLKEDVKRWESLAPHLIQDLFTKVGCKPLIQKY